MPEPLTHADVRRILRLLSGEVRDVRQARGLSLRELARETGVSFSTLGRIERGKGPDGPTLIRLARWLVLQARKRDA